MNREYSNIISSNAKALPRRYTGYSPEYIRDAVWDLVNYELKGSVLDAGSGEGVWLKRLKQSKAIERIISTDIVDEGAGQIEGIEFYLTDLSCSPLPCSDKELDWVFAIEVIEHLANPRHFILEAHRCLKDNGRLFVTTPCNESLTAKLSFLFRGYFPAFSEYNYLYTGHITPIMEIDLYRMSREANFKQIRFYYHLPGRIPKTGIYWQQILPFLHGKLWSDCLLAILTK